MVAWVIFDEAHYFYSDACFNSHLDQLLWKLPDLFSRAHRLYLTATPGAVLPDICAAEQSNLKTCGQCRFCHRDRAGKLLMYQFPNHSGSVKLAYFRQIDEIADLMASRPGEEFLIFTFRRETGDISDTRSYKKALASRSITFEYLDRFSKGGAVWNEVCANSRFSSQALVCTSVLDCSVSLHDPKLRHIVVETTDKTEFLQMLEEHIAR